MGDTSVARFSHPLTLAPVSRFLRGALFLADVSRLKMIPSLSSSIFFNPWPAFFCLQNRLNELGQNLAIRIEQW